MNLFWKASYSLFQREVLRFVRQKNRIVGALGTPLVFWFFIGSGLQNTVRQGSLMPAGQTSSIDYLQYFFPGTIVLILLFTAIFSTISIIEDRQQGFLQGVLVSPIPRTAIVFGKLLSGAVLATAQGLIFILLAPLMHIHFGILDGVLITLMLFFLSFGLTGLGFLFAWTLDSTQGFHAIMNLCLMPLWLVSGSLFPVDSAPHWLKAVMMLNPLTYSVAILHRGFFHTESTSILYSYPLSFSITLIFCLIMFAGSLKLTTKTSRS